MAGLPIRHFAGLLAGLFAGLLSRRSLYTALLFLELFFLASSAHANDASFVGDGATVFAMQEKRVRMKKEVIHITYDNQAKADRRRWKADCQFDFENLSDEGVDIKMGFPNWRGFGEGMGRDPYAIMDFHTEVDGKPVPNELKTIDLTKQTGPWNQKGKIATFEGAILWPVTIKAKSENHVHNTFSFGSFSSNGPFNVFEHMPATYPIINKKDLFWSVRKTKKKDIDFANGIIGSVAYITTTGQTWQGPIGEAQISIDLPPWLQDSPHYMIPYPTGYRLQKDKISWDIKNYSPKSEIVIYYLRHVFTPDEQPNPTESIGFEYKDQAEAWLKFSAKSSVAPEVLERLIAISKKPEVKAVLTKALKNLH